jgi:hypothetical protein
VQTVYELAVAYMRLGETRNCAMRHTSESCIFPLRGGGVHVEREPSEQAVRYFTEALERVDPRDWYYPRARWLLNVAEMTLGGYPEDVPAQWRIPPETFAAEEAFPRFADVAPGLGLNAFDLAGGAIAEDFDGDGLLDVMTSTSDTSGPMHLWVNNGDGTFDERTREAGLVGQLGGLNLIQADYDNDGWVDVLVLRGGWWRAEGRHPNSLLRNLGHGVFGDVTYEAGLGEVHHPTQTADWADYDLDGDVDLYVGNEWNAARENVPAVDAPCQLFRNNGDGTFTDVAAAAGVENRRYAKSVVWGDYDNDGDPDLYVSNLGAGNRLYRNEADGTFKDVAEAAGVTRPIASFPAWFWDYDNDGALDLFVSGYGGPRVPPDVASVAASYLGIDSGAERARVYRGDGRGGFTEVGGELGLERITLPMGARNREGKRFSDITTAGGFGHLQKGHGVVFADLDNDGDQDLLEQVGGAYPGDAFGNALYENPGFGAHWIKLKLVGQRSNRSGIGARIVIEIDEAGNRRRVVREVGTGGSFGGNPLRLEIGLGAAERIERLEIHWPGGERVQAFEHLAADRAYAITEGSDEPETLELPVLRLSAAD